MIHLLAVQILVVGVVFLGLAIGGLVCTWLRAHEERAGAPRLISWAGGRVPR